MWQGLSRHLVELGSWQATDFDLRQPPLLPIPFVVLLLDTHERSLPNSDSRLDPNPLPRGYRGHQREADDMRELSGVNLDF